MPLVFIVDVRALSCYINKNLGLRPNWNIGIMEYWNDGSRGRKTINMTFSAFVAHYSIIPSFHHSMGPRGKATKSGLTSISCRNSETLN
jgi:hypothetical protein